MKIANIEQQELAWNAEIRLYPHDRLFAYILEPLTPKWVKPNHITVLRFFLTPFVLWFLVAGNYSVGVPLFIFTALTDAYDGSLARVRKQITGWGILYDPLADKLLIGSVLFIIVLKHINFYIGMGLIVAELIMVIGAWARRNKGVIQPASIWGKVKMFAEVVGVFLLLLAIWLDISILVELSTGTLALALAVAIVSILSRLHKP